MISFIIAFAVSFFYIWLKAFQQLNVMHHKVKFVMPISMLMALCEVSIIGLVVAQSFWLFIPIGLGGGFGCITAMKNHAKLRKWLDRGETE